MNYKHVLVIDDSVTSLKLIEKVLKPYYKVSLIISAVQALKFLSKNTPDLILLDTDISNINGYEILRNIKEKPQLSNIPIILLINMQNYENQIKGIEFFASDFIIKPIIPEIMLTRIKMHLKFCEYKNHLENKVNEKTKVIEHLQDVMMLSLAELVECRDENTGGHVKRTAQYVKILTEDIYEAGLYNDILTDEYIRDIIRSAPLHDLGKIGINDSTLLKTGAFDNEEFEYMKNHAELGGQTIQKMINETNVESFLHIAKDMAHYHHERWDGSGYPCGLKGEEIPLSARIMAIADVYDALTTKRPYKDAFEHDVALNIRADGKGKMFDPKIVEVFEKKHHRFKLINLQYNK